MWCVLHKNNKNKIKNKVVKWINFVNLSDANIAYFCYCPFYSFEITSKSLKAAIFLTRFLSSVES